MAQYPITYAKKDILVKNYLEAQTDVPTSRMVALAIEYYAKTGRYLPLSRVSMTDEHPAKKKRCVFFPKNSKADEYIQSQKDSAKTIICDVVNNGVTLGDKTDKITMEMYLIAQKAVQTGVQFPNTNGTSLYEAYAGLERKQPDAFETAKEKAQTAQVKVEEVQSDDAEQKERADGKKRITFGDQFIKNTFS